MTDDTIKVRRVDRGSLLCYLRDEWVNDDERVDCVHAMAALKAGQRIVLTVQGKDAATATLDCGIVRQEALVVGLDGQTQI